MNGNQLIGVKKRQCTSALPWAQGSN